MIAAAAMSFSSVSVIGNALRLRRAGDGEGAARPSDKGGHVDWPGRRKLRSRKAAAARLRACYFRGMNPSAAPCA